MTRFGILALIALSSLCCTSAKSAQPLAPTAHPEPQPTDENSSAQEATESNSAAADVGLYTVKVLEGMKLIANSVSGPAFQITATGASVTTFDAGTAFPGLNIDGQLVLVSFTARPSFASGPAAPGIMLAQHFHWEYEHFKKTMSEGVVPSPKLHFVTPKCGVVCADWAVDPATGSSFPRSLALSIALPNGVLALTSPVTNADTPEKDMRAVLYGIANTLQTQESAFPIKSLSDAERARDPSQGMVP